MMVLNSSFSEFDEFNAFTAEWDIDFRQVSCGLLNASLVQLMANNHSIARAKFDQVTYQQGATIPGMRTFAFLDACASEMDWCGYRFSPDSIAIFAKDRDFRCVSPAGFSVYTISFTEEELAATSCRLGLPNICDRLNSHAEVRLVSREKINVLRSILEVAIAGAVSPATPVYSDGLPSNYASDCILEYLVSTLSANDCITGQPSADKLTGATNRALEFIEAHLEDRPTIQELTRVAGVSRRSLEYAFRRQLDMSPKAFINQQRMILVRRDLRNLDGHQSIADIANRWGYWHMGQFAKDYQRRFGELPSKTAG